MPKYAVLSAIIAAALLLPGQIASASSSPTDQLVKTLQPIISQLHSQAGTVSIQGKSYTSKKNGFTLTLPTGWVKLTPPAGILFAAQPADNTSVEWLFAVTKYKTQKQADTASHTLLKHPKDYGQLLLTSLQTQFPTATCVLDRAFKKTIGGYIGGRAVVTCTMEGSTYTFGVFSYVRKLNYYSVTFMAPQSAYATYSAQVDSIIKSLKFTK
ncbi:MAG: hypothetical protein V1907_02710 [Candidatus Kerfeldbacteria bacterium]